MNERAVQEGLMHAEHRQVTGSAYLVRISYSCMVLYVQLNYSDIAEKQRDVCLEIQSGRLVMRTVGSSLPLCRAFNNPVGEQGTGGKAV